MKFSLSPAGVAGALTLLALALTLLPLLGRASMLSGSMRNGWCGDSVRLPFSEGYHLPW